ncbi:MAG: HdeD family acid-resistance protein [Leptolyngbyaceae cyanobacterium CSU_1_3]|nr:HdeD family acid-resistance protein [Leptolyngbyaceae cyanobacterium CSU_1_3]
MTTNISGDMQTPIAKKSNKGSLWIGVLLIVLGVVAIALPAVSTIFAETWIALIILSAGFAKFGYAFQTREDGGFVWKILLSLLYVSTGIMLFVNPLTGILTLTLLLAGFLFTEGIFEIILAFRLRPQQNWAWVLGNGVVTLLLGGMIWFQFPFDAPWLIGTLVGVSVLFTGISRVALALNPRLVSEADSTAST